MHLFLNDFSKIDDYEYLKQSNLDQEQISTLISHKDDFFRLKGASYQDQQYHSSVIDGIYGFNIASTEELIARSAATVYSDFEVWSGLKPEQLQTPYDELRRVLADCDFQDGETLIDLGAGYGRAGIIVGERFPNSSFIGIEVASERVAEGNRIFSDFNFSHCELRAQEAHDPKTIIDPAKIYFIYDFGLPSQIEQTISRLCERAFEEEFYVVARGRGVRSIINYKFPKLWSAYNPLHGETYSIYSTFKDVKASEQSL